MTRYQCNAIVKETGKLCLANRFVSSTKLCIFHCPEDKELRRKLAQKGGYARMGKPLNLKDFKVKGIADVKVLVEAVLTSVGRGDKIIPARDLSSLGKLYIEACEKSDLEKRLKVLESDNTKE